MEEARKDSVFGNVDVNLKFNKPELTLRSDSHEGNKSRGSMFLDISNILQFRLKADEGMNLFPSGTEKQYYVIGRGWNGKSRSAPADITSLYVQKQKAGPR